MKKLILLVLVLLMVYPLVSAQTSDITVEMYENVVIRKSGQYIVNVDGFVTDGTGEHIGHLNGEKVRDLETNLTYEIRGGYFLAKAVLNNYGQYKYEFVESQRIKRDEVGYYLDINENNQRDSNEPSLIPPEFFVIPEIALEGNLQFDLDDDFHAIVGTIEGMQGKTIGVRYKGEGVLATNIIGENGSFGILVTPGRFSYAGGIELVLDINDGNGFQAIKEGKVVGKELNASISQSSFSRGIINKNIKVNIKDIPSEYIINNSLKSDYRFRVQLFEGEELISSKNNQNILIRSGESQSFDYEALSYRGLRELAVGEYRVVISLMGRFNNQWKDIYQKDLKLDVLRADTDILVNEALKNSYAGTISIDLGGEDNTTTSDDIVFYKGGKPVQTTRSSSTIHGGYVLKYNSPGQSQEIVHTLRTESSSNIYPNDLPAGLNQRDYLGINQTIIDVPTYQGGVFNYTLEVYALENKSYKVIHRVVDSIDITGYQVDVENDLMYVNKESIQKIIIKDDSMQPINNALIYIGKNSYGVNSPTQKRPSTPGLNESGRYEGDRAYLFLDPAKENIQNGEYVVEDFSLPELGKYNIIVYQISNNEATRMAVLENAIEVKGDQVYTVTVDNSFVRPGQEQTFHIMVRDSSGRQVVPYAIDIFEDGLAYRTINQIEINANQTANGTRIIHTPRVTTKEDLTFRVRDESSSQTGEAKINVSNPNIIFDQLSPMITEAIREPLGFVINDSLNHQRITDDIYLELVNGGTGSSLRVVDQDGSQEIFGKISGSDEYKLEILVSNLNYEEINQAGVEPRVNVYLGEGMQVYSIPVNRAQVLTEPAELTTNATEIKIAYKNAKGEPLISRDIYVNDTLVDKTDNNGEYKYYFSSSINVLNLRLETDVSGYFNEIAVRRSATQPSQTVVSAPDIVYSPEVSLRIRYDVPMAYVFVNNQRQDYFLPVTTYTAKVDNLKPGKNDIYVRIQDMRQNSSYYHVEVYYQEQRDPIMLTIGRGTDYGIPTLVLGTTMVPVRFAEDLGAEMKWDNSTKTVTYTSFNTTIRLQEGNSYGYINEERRRLPVAPYMNENQRLMVPLRMIAQELGFRVDYIDQFSPIKISVR
jgi:hypothetical protein